jgi:hypothetical protein
MRSKIINLTLLMLRQKRNNKIIENINYFHDSDQTSIYLKKILEEKENQNRILKNKNKNKIRINKKQK